MTMPEKNIAIKEHYRLLSKKIIKNLKSRQFDACYCDNTEETVQMALSLIPAESSVSWGGSVTLEETGLLVAVKQSGYTVIDRDTAATADDRFQLMRQSLCCDTYLTSFNAVSEDGILINVDSVGNRVAAIAFGPRSVIAIVGMNKVCKTMDDAIVRARTYAAPLNAQRCTINPFFSPVQNTPCMRDGSCGNCRADDCICSHIVQTRMCKTPGRIKVILVGESLGF